MNGPMSLTVSDEVADFLMRQPKALLVDCYVQVLATARGFCDSEVPLDEVREDVRAMQEMRSGG